MPAKPKAPHKKHVLKPIRREPFTPRADKPEGVCIADRGYWTGAHYTREEVEFLTAVEKWQRKHRTKFLASIAFLRIVKELGYVRPEQPTTTSTTDA